MPLSRPIAALALLGLAAAAQGAAIQSAAVAASLPAYGADPQQTSVSGVSSGAFMAVQLQVAYSASIMGAGIVAGGPYYCAAGNLLFTGICMGLMKPNAEDLLDSAKSFASAQLIDPLNHLSQRRIYVFSGTEDNIVRQRAVDSTVSFFQKAGVSPERLQYVNKMPAGHALITPAYGNDCAANAEPYISHCSTTNGQGYDQAQALLQHIYGPLNPRVEVPAGKLISFNQRAYASAATSMAETGYVYVPPECAAGASGVSSCRVHVALHGCNQSAESVGDKFYSKTGYNQWADSNKLIILYPQVNKSGTMFTSNPQGPFNPDGCWDWWGYTSAGYAYKSGPQMKAIKDMINHLTQPAQKSL